MLELIELIVVAIVVLVATYWGTDWCPEEPQCKH